MTYQELVAALRSTGYPVAYSHFTATSVTPVPQPPFICYVDSFSDNFIADNQVLHEMPNIQIELYTTKKDLVAEGKVRDALNALKMPYNSTGPIWIQDEGYYQKIYEVRMI